MVMNFKNLLIAVFVIPLLVACKKDNNKTTMPGLAAKWNLVTDYTANHLAQINTYTGVPGDYFDFRSNGKCYVKEGGHYDTLLYAITSDTTITIKPFAFNNAAYYSSQSNPLTLHAAIITSAGPYPPGEVDYRQVKLSR
jgi:hypothetical protein